MGRKTWDSIPPRFRPLKGRLNVVLSRSHPASLQSPLSSAVPEDGPVQLSSLRAAIHALNDVAVSKVFVIGGAEIYAAAARLPEAKRLLITRVQTDFECDAFLDVRLDERGGGGADNTHTGSAAADSTTAPASVSPWRKCSQQQLDRFVGEQVPAGEQEENGTTYVFEMYERD